MCLTALVVICGLSHLLRSCRHKLSRKNAQEVSVKDDVNVRYEEINDTALNGVSLYVNGEKSKIIYDNATDSNVNNSRVLEENDNEHLYHSLAENWKSDFHAYDVTTNVNPDLKTFKS